MKNKLWGKSGAKRIIYWHPTKMHSVFTGSTSKPSPLGILSKPFQFSLPHVPDPTKKRSCTRLLTIGNKQIYLHILGHLHLKFMWTEFERSISLFLFNVNLYLILENSRICHFEKGVFYTIIIFYYVHSLYFFTMLHKGIFF